MRKGGKGEMRGKCCPVMWMFCSFHIGGLVSYKQFMGEESSAGTISDNRNVDDAGDP